MLKLVVFLVAAVLVATGCDKDRNKGGNAANNSGAVAPTPTPAPAPNPGEPVAQPEGQPEVQPEGDVVTEEIPTQIVLNDEQMQQLRTEVKTLVDNAKQAEQTLANLPRYQEETKAEFEEAQTKHAEAMKVEGDLATYLAEQTEELTAAQNTLANDTANAIAAKSAHEVAVAATQAAVTAQEAANLAVATAQDLYNNDMNADTSKLLEEAKTALETANANVAKATDAEKPLHEASIKAEEKYAERSSSVLAKGQKVQEVQQQLDTQKKVVAHLLNNVESRGAIYKQAISAEHKQALEEQLQKANAALEEMRAKAMAFGLNLDELINEAIKNAEEAK